MDTTKTIMKMSFESTGPGARSAINDLEVLVRGAIGARIMDYEILNVSGVHANDESKLTIALARRY